MNSLISGGLILSIFCAFIIFKKESKKQADLILGSILLILSLNYLLISFPINEHRNFAPHLFGLAASLILVYGPMIYFYVLAYTDKRHLSFKNSFYHFLPFLFYIICNIYYFLNDNFKEHNYLEEAYLNGHLGFFYIVTALKSLHPLVYLIFSISMVIHHQRAVKNIYSYDASTINIKWMRYLVLSMMALIIIAMLLNIFRVGKEEKIYHMAGEIISAFGTIWVFTIGYYGLKKTPVFISIKKSASEKYQNTKVNEDNAEEIKDALIHKMESEKLYLNPKLNISDLSESIKYPGYQISQVLNDKMGMTFFDFVNDYRVKEIINRMAEKNFLQLTLLGNALECGFNSKASFNRIFKKNMGITPSEYYKQNHG